MRRTRHLPAALAGLAVTLMAAALYLPGLDRPHGAVWDETYYATAIQRQVEGRAQFASHPPLGFLLLAGGARLAGYPIADFHALGATKQVDGSKFPPDYPFGAIRLASALAAIVCAPLFYGLMLTLTCRVMTASILSNLFLFETDFLSQFRAAQLDAFLMMFSLLAALLLARALKRDRSSAPLEVGFGAAVGAAMTIKTVGLLLAIGGPILLALRAWRRRRRERPVRRLAALCASGAIMSAGFAGVILAVYVLQVALAPLPPASGTPAGDRDLAFLSEPYAARLIGRAPFSPKVLLGAITDDVRYMASDMAGVPRKDANGSSPLTWPLFQKPVSYRWDEMDGRRAHVMLVANPVGWIAGLAGLLAAPWLIWRASTPFRRSAAVLLAGMWALQMAAHIVIGQARVVYLYHYFPALAFSWGLFALMIAELDARQGRSRILGRAFAGLAILHLIAFAALCPLVFHMPLTPSECRVRVSGAAACGE